MISPGVGAASAARAGDPASVIGSGFAAGAIAADTTIPYGAATASTTGLAGS